MIAELAALASTAVAAAAVLAGLVVLASTGSPRLAVAVGLELLVGAGLLRLAVATTFTPIPTAAGIIAIRWIAARGLSYPAPANLT